ncbi:hypothetical protein PS15p_212289 [Mucor circinelloides]
MEEPSDVNDFGIMDEASLHLGTVYIAPVSLAGTRIKLSINIPDVIYSSGHPLSGSSTIIIIKSYQETSYALSICHLLSSHAILCAAYSQCNVKTTAIQNVIYTSTINQAILLSMLLLFYTQDQAILLINAVSYLYKSIQIQNKSYNIH